MPATMYALVTPTKAVTTDIGYPTLVPYNDYTEIKAYTGMPALNPERLVVRIINADTIAHKVSFGFGALVAASYFVGGEYKTFSGDRPLGGTNVDRGKLAGAPYVVIVSPGTDVWFGPFQSARVLDHYHAAIGVTLGEDTVDNDVSIVAFQLARTAHPKPSLLDADFNIDFNN